MQNAERYSFVVPDDVTGKAEAQPYLPIQLISAKQSLKALGLLDTGATVNVLPHQIGIDLGMTWEQQTTVVQLTGNLGQVEARAVLLSVKVGKFTPVNLAFAWTQATKVPLLLGQVNFFMEYDVCFYGSQKAFEVAPKADSS